MWCETNEECLKKTSLVDGPVQDEGLGGRGPVTHLVEEAVGAVDARVHVVLVKAAVFLST